MAKGEESLRLEIARRHANTPNERRLVPAPPSPTTSSSVPLLMAFVAGTFLLGSMGYLVLRSSSNDA